MMKVMDKEDMRTLLLLLKHRSFVSDGLVSIAKALEWRARVHDRSKLNNDEFFGVVQLKDAVSTTEYGTKDYFDAVDRVDKATGCVSKHFERNRHHPEHFEKNGGEMGFLDVIEMVCDWHGAYQSYNGPDSEISWLDHLRKNIERFRDHEVFSGGNVWKMELALDVGFTLNRMRGDE